MKSYQFFTADGRGGTMLCDDETLADAVAELSQRFSNVIRVQIGKEQWLADQQPEPEIDGSSQPSTDGSD
tara:strand:+ start:13076 stop:13285 length:210 start_codon:yes stop_codon:yes gene_type:complete